MRFERAEAETAKNKPDSQIAIDQERPLETFEWHSEWQSRAAPESRCLWDSALTAALKAKATELAATLPADAVEKALQDALAKATAEGKWSDVAALAHDLEARRRARAATVDLAAERTRRGGGR
ncbi:MAG: hypothetical protein IPM35_27965 [Myxococcales bacterium]|nr:hypothetical protein [Myxococcales bacterium]